MPPPASNDTGRPTTLGQDGSDKSRDLATLTFDVGGHGACGWWGSSSSIRTPSLKFVGLAVRKIWRTMCVSINGPSDPDLWLFHLETGMRVASKVGTFIPNLGTLGLWVFQLFAMYATDGRKKKQRLMPLPYGRGHNNAVGLNLNKILHFVVTATCIDHRVSAFTLHVQ